MAVCIWLLNVIGQFWVDKRILDLPFPLPPGFIANEDFWSPPYRVDFAKNRKKIRKDRKHIEKVGEYPNKLILG